MDGLAASEVVVGHVNEAEEELTDFWTVPLRAWSGGVDTCRDRRGNGVRGAVVGGFTVGCGGSGDRRLEGSFWYGPLA